MKISITNTVLRAMPNIAWEECCDFLSSGEELSPIQQAASAGLWYYYAAMAGFADFFEGHSQLDRYELADTLITIGARDFADNLQRAYAAFERGEDMAEPNMWYVENEQRLIEAVYNFVMNNEYEFFEIVEEDYELRPPKGLFVFGLVTAAFFWALMIIFALLNPEDWPLIVASFFAISMLGIILMLYTKLWRATVKGEVLTVHSPLRRARVIRISEVSAAKRRRDNIAIYVNGKSRKAAAIETAVGNFSLLIAQLSVAGKIEEKKFTNIYSIRHDKVRIAELGGLALAAAAAFIWALLNKQSIYEILFFAALLLAALVFLLGNLRWRVDVAGSYVSFHRLFRGVLEFSLRDVTAVKLYGQDMTIYLGEKKIFTIREGYKNSDLFQLALREASVPFI